MQKQELRRLFLNKRNNLDLSIKNSNEALIASHLLIFLKKFPNIKKIGIYESFGSEVNTNQIINLLQDNYLVYVCKINLNKELVFVPISLSNKHWKQAISNEILDQYNSLKLDLIFAPLLVFDKNKNRIGYGQGNFDNYFHNHKVIKVGLAYDMQKYESIIQTDNHDVQLDYIITQKGIY